MYALRQGVGDQILKSRTDMAYLSKGLSDIAAKRHEAAVPESSCEAQILQAFMHDALVPPGGPLFKVWNAIRFMVQLEKIHPVEKSRSAN